MGESQYSYPGLPDPAAYFTGQPGNIFICDGASPPPAPPPAPPPDPQTPNTRARRVVHEVIV